MIVHPMLSDEFREAKNMSGRVLNGAVAGFARIQADELRMNRSLATPATKKEEWRKTRNGVRMNRSLATPATKSGNWIRKNERMSVRMNCKSGDSGYEEL